jgi:hypothetical protein
MICMSYSEKQRRKNGFRSFGKGGKSRNENNSSFEKPKETESQESETDEG